MISSKFLIVDKGMLQDELTLLQENFNKLHDVRDEIVLDIESRKLKLRQLTDSNKFFMQLKKFGEIQEKPTFSSLYRDKLLRLLDRDISLIQNQYDMVFNELKNLKTEINERINVVDKTEFIMNILNYKIYEVRYNFRERLENLKDEKEKLTNELNGTNASEVALRLVEIEKDLMECENTHESQMQSIKEQKLDAQKHYETAVGVLDIMIESVRKYYNTLLQLIQAEKEQLSDLQNEIAEVKYSIELESLQKDIDRFTELQTTGWRTKKPIEDMSVLLEERGLKFTDSGLLITESGRRITYDEAREQNLLEDITFSLDLLMDKGKDNASFKDLKEDSKSSDYSRICSDDVQYLKENLGTALTLALSEITAVQPRDPIHYLGHWLFKYRYNQQMSDIQKIELQQINEEREKIARQKWNKFLEEEAKTAVLDCIVRAEQESARREVLRIERELAEGEEENPWDMEFRDKFVDFK